MEGTAFARLERRRDMRRHRRADAPGVGYRANDCPLTMLLGSVKCEMGARDDKFVAANPDAVFESWDAMGHWLHLRR